MNNVYAVSNGHPSVRHTDNSEDPSCNHSNIVNVRVIHHFTSVK